MAAPELILAESVVRAAFGEPCAAARPETHPPYAEGNRPQGVAVPIFVLYFFAGLRVNKGDFQTKPQSLCDFL